jgi:hypothetical protein
MDKDNTLTKLIGGLPSTYGVGGSKSDGHPKLARSLVKRKIPGISPRLTVSGAELRPSDEQGGRQLLDFVGYLPFSILDDIARILNALEKNLAKLVLSRLGAPVRGLRHRCLVHYLEFDLLEVWDYPETATGLEALRLSASRLSNANGDARTPG